MKHIIFAFALRFYGLLMVAVILSLLSGLGTLAIFSGIVAAIGSIAWFFPIIKQQVAGLKSLISLLTALVLVTILYPVLAMYLIYYVNGVVSIAIPLILYFVSSSALIFLSAFQIQRKNAKHP